MSEVFILSEKCFVIILYMLKTVLMIRYYSNVLDFLSFKPSAVHLKLRIFDFLEASISTLFQKVSCRCQEQQKTKSNQLHLGSSFDAPL